MSTPHTDSRVPARAGADAPVPPPAPPDGSGPSAGDGRFRRLAARIGAAVRRAHSDSVPF